VAFVLCLVAKANICWHRKNCPQAKCSIVGPCGIVHGSTGAVAGLMVQSGRHHDGDYYCSDVRGLGWARASRLFWVGTLKDVLMLEGLFSESGHFVGLGAIKCVGKEFGFDWSALTYSVMALPKSPSLTKISPDYGASHSTRTQLR